MTPALEVLDIAAPNPLLCPPGRYVETALARQSANQNRWIFVPNPLLGALRGQDMPDDAVLTGAMVQERPLIFTAVQEGGRKPCVPLAYLIPPRFRRKREVWPLRFLSGQCAEADAALLSRFAESTCELRSVPGLRVGESGGGPFGRLLPEMARRATVATERGGAFRVAYALPHRFNDGLIYLSLLPRARPGLLILSPGLAPVAAKRLPGWPTRLTDEEPYFARLLAGTPASEEEDLVSFYFERVVQPAIPDGMAVQILPPFPWVVGPQKSALGQLEFALDVQDPGLGDG